MNREAVALGTPVYTIFSGAMGAVDEQLIAEGRLRELSDPAEIELVEARGAARGRQPARPAAAGRRGALAAAVAHRAAASGESGRCAPSTPRTRSWPSSSRPPSPGCWSRRPSRSPRKIGAIDEPKERGLHDVPTPKLGGLAILVARARRRRDLAALGRGDALDPAAAPPRSPRSGSPTTSSTCRRCRSCWARSAAALIPVVWGDVRVDVTTLPFVGGFDTRLGAHIR